MFDEDLFKQLLQSGNDQNIINADIVPIIFNANNIDIISDDKIKDEE